MSFLHGVLSGVKDDDNVTTYDTKKLFNDLPSSISKLMHKGSNDFQTAITQVSAALQAWSGELEGRTGGLNKALNTLLTDRFNDFNSALFSLNKLKPEQLDKVPARLGDCFKQAGELSKAFDEAEKAHTKLDINLHNKLNSSMNSIKVSVRAFVAGASNSELRAVVETAATRLNKLKLDVNIEIKKRVDHMGGRISYEFQEQIRKPINEINTDLKAHMELLNDWIQKAADVVQKGIEKCEEILKRVDKKDHRSITNSANKLKEKARALLAAYSTAHQRVRELVNITVPAALQELEGEMTRDLLSLQQSIASELKAHAKSILGTVKYDVENILNGDPPNQGKGLKGIESAVKAYAEKFGSEQFDGTMQRWVGEILKENELSGRLNTYVQDNPVKQGVKFIKHNRDTGKFQIEEEGIAMVARVIKDKIIVQLKGGEFQEAQQKIDQLAKDDSNEKIKGYVDSVKTICQKFSEKVAENFPGNVRQIASDIKRDLFNNKIKRPDPDHLTWAVERILEKLVITGKEAARQLQSLLLNPQLVGNAGDFTIAKELDKVAEKTRKLHKNLGDAAPRDGDSSGKFSALVDGVATEVKRTIPDKILLDTQMQNYKRKTAENADSQYRTLLKKHIPEVLNAFKDNVDSEGNGVVSKTISNVQQRFDTISKELAEITSMFNANNTGGFRESDNKGVKTLLIELRKGLGNGEGTWRTAKNGLTEIKGRLAHLQNTTLTTLLQAAKNFYTDVIQAEATKTTADIEAYVIQEVKETTEEIQKKTQHDYYQKISRMFKEVHHNVEIEIGNINIAIKEDLNAGPKGLLRRMRGGLEASGSPNSAPNKLKELKLEDVKEPKKQVKTAAQPFIREDNDMSYAVNKIHDHLTKLLTHLNNNENRKYNFDHEFLGLNDSLTNALKIFTPAKLSGIFNAPLIDALRAGLTEFCAQLGHAYVNKYSGEDWKKNHADKYAKIMLTSTSTLYEELYHLFYNSSKNWRQLKIDGPEKSNALREYIEDQGFRTDNLINKYNSGEQVAEKLKSAFNHQVDFQTNPETNDTGHNTLARYLYWIRQSKGPVSLLYWNLATYFKTCHIRIPAKTIYPCTIRDMLGWLCGLPYTAVYKNIQTHCDTLLTNDATYQSDTVLLPILRSNIRNSLAPTCQFGYQILTAISGNGRGFEEADYPYACNFCDNSRNFYYPQNVSELFDMLKDICTRVLSSLCFLSSRCKYTVADGNGWRDCQYGGKVSGYQWDCKKSVDKPMCQANGQPKCQANGQPTCQPNTKPNCQPKSPLQAHLTDSLPGHLPHKLSSVGCTSKCSTCPKQSPGMICLTPMGFWDLAHAGSKKGTGKDICNVLSEFCGNADSPLPTLLNSLMQVSPTPPKSLADQFSFFTSFFRQWSSGRFSTSDRLVNHMNTKIIPAMSMKLYADEATNFTNQLKSLSGPTSDHPVTKTDKSTHCDLYSLCTHTEVASQIKCNEVNSQCAPYLKPLCADAYHTYATKHANLYLSWLTYLPFDFYNLLKSLFEAFCNIDCKSGGCSACNCAVGKHGLQFQCTCKSYVQCHGVSMILNNYGFTFGNSKTLMANPDRRFCHNFYYQLKKVIESNHFKTLLGKCDDILYYIRSPFMNTLLALWSLSLLYLLHIAVVRLDVLRIRSHLRSPASHRIAAQSLLAAARVKALANVKYFSP
ncbi:hypothetical protein, conserved [Babesia ovata]|uniref:Uncharacterized protein n=1 Tax=Babesia ovata TaxID=189622 RepID=A0A2H6KAJ3_9APIC|nr:uncharacterized protein BOVATA_014990 [Babesia ovata]GBE60006.1 hypothetical protein, conserved [Babesia ovata]